MGIVKAVCISREKGTRKENVKEAVFIENHGLQGDAHEELASSVSLFIL